MKQASIRNIIWLFLLTRLMLVIVTYFGYILLTQPKFSSAPVDAATLLTSWNHWDGANYVRIAQYGYQTRFDVAFFPLFPLLIALIAHVLGSWSYLIVGVLLSNAALLGALIVLYQIVVDATDDRTALRTVLYLCIFPTAFYFFAPYNESLFLLLITGSFLAMRRQRWVVAGILGLLAALTRSAGVLLIVPYLYELWVARERVLANRYALLRGILPLFLIPLGTLLYSVYCWHIRGDPLAFATLQYHWGRHLSWPWQGIWHGLFNLFWNQPFGSSNEAHVLLDLSATFGFLLLTILGWRRLRGSYSLWMIMLLVYILLSPSTDIPDALQSNQRFVLEMFPGFITLAILGVQHPRLHQTLLMVFPPLLATLSILFIMNRWLV
ncbi:MAG TPA: mannosyltransferase family protein [Ktedonobacteraceae bacterium]|nr:mannosyltransferase family protein [Ktedonobacteraceae bacterium]